MMVKGIKLLMLKEKKVVDEAPLSTALTLTSIQLDLAL